VEVNRNNTDIITENSNQTLKQNITLTITMIITLSVTLTLSLTLITSHYSNQLQIYDYAIPFATRDP